MMVTSKHTRLYRVNARRITLVEYALHWYGPFAHMIHPTPLGLLSVGGPSVSGSSHWPWDSSVLPPISPASGGLRSPVFHS